MYIKLILAIFIGFVAAKRGNKIYIPLVKMESGESSESDSESSQQSDILKKLDLVKKKMESEINDIHARC